MKLYFYLLNTDSNEFVAREIEAEEKPMTFRLRNDFFPGSYRHVMHKDDLGRLLHSNNGLSFVSDHPAHDQAIDAMIGTLKLDERQMEKRLSRVKSQLSMLLNQKNRHTEEG